MKELERDFFEYDENNRKIIELSYDSIDDILVKNGELTPFVSTDFEDKLHNIAKENKPKRVKLDLIIKDKKEYDLETIKTILLKNAYLREKDAIRKRKNGLFIIGFMILFGVILLAISYAIDKYTLKLITDVINISGTLVIWEAFYLFFFIRNQTAIVNVRMAKLFINMNVY